MPSVAEGVLPTASEIIWDNLLYFDRQNSTMDLSKLKDDI